MKYNTYVDKQAWKAKKEIRAASIVQDIFRSHGVAAPTKKAYLKLGDFGKDLYFRRINYNYTADDFIRDVNALFQLVKKTTENATTTLNSREMLSSEYMRFKAYFSDLDYFPPLNLLTVINTDQEIKDLIINGYNLAKSRPNDKLVYFGRELFYRGTVNGYTYDNFIRDIDGIVFFPRREKVNISAYNDFCRRFSGYEFFPTYQQMKDIKKGNFLDLIRSGYEKAMKEPDKSSNFVDNTNSTRKRVPPHEC